MAGIHVVTRKLRSGEKRFHVRMSGTRYDPIQHLGSFKKQLDAERAAGRARAMLEEGVTPTREDIAAQIKPTSRVTVSAMNADWLDSLVDLKPKTTRSYRFLSRHVVAAFGTRDARSLRPREIQVWLVALKFEPRSLPKYRRILAATLDYGGVAPNPARDRTIRLPRAERREYRLPNQDELERIRGRMSDRHAMEILLLEHTGMRVGEAASLEWTDRDAARGRLFVREAKTAAGRRWISDLPEYPAELVAFLNTPPAERAVSKYILGGHTAGSIAAALRYACERAGIQVFSPHDLRHRHASWLHDQRWTGAEMAARLGHSNAQQSLTTYTHVMPPE